MSHVCVFVDVDGNTCAKKSLSQEESFAEIKGFIPQAKLLFCYMGWRLYGVAEENCHATLNNAATSMFQKICKSSSQTLHGAVAFWFQSATNRAYEKICE